MKTLVTAVVTGVGLGLCVTFLANATTGQQVNENVPGLAGNPGGGLKKERGNENVDQDRWMKAKQSHAQEIFAGLTEGDFEKMAASGRLLLGSGILDMWLRDNDFDMRSDYRGQMHALEYANKELIRHAEDKNIEGALTAYVSLSQSCVRCHVLIRDQQRAARQTVPLPKKD